MTTANQIAGYLNNILQIDLNTGKVAQVNFDEATLRNYIGGVGLGIKILYDEVAPGIEWSDPQNRLIFATGPVNGTSVAGSGTFSVVTKGSLTNGGTSSQANGYFGAFLKLSGVDALIINGAASKWSYVYIHDGTAEVKDASHLVGKDTVETQELLAQELGRRKSEVSIYCIGLAGENLVRFAAILGDGGHCAAHNGVGAVMGSKKLKAIVAERGRSKQMVNDSEKLSQLSKQMKKEATRHPLYSTFDKWGTSALFPNMAASGSLPIKNLTTNIPFTDPTRFVRVNYPSYFEMEHRPCWACPYHHVQMIKITDGPYAGLVAKDPEFECAAAWSYLIGNNNLEAAIMLSDITDRLGLDCNEAGWAVALLIECFEKGIVTNKDTDGLEMTWGNVEAVKTILNKIAEREGIGDILAEGVMRASQHIGGEAPNLGVYLKKGFTPRMHDGRARWWDILDYATSGVGTTESNPGRALEFSPKSVAEMVAAGKIRSFIDSLVVCDFITMTYREANIKPIVEILNAITGWDFTHEDAIRMALRVTNLFRVFNFKHGITVKLEEPSVRYASAPVDGPAQGKSILSHWNEMLDHYYEIMGWDRTSGKPLPQTLSRLGLQSVIGDIWPLP